MGELAIWRHLVVARIRGDWQYRTSFALTLASQTVVAAVDLAGIAIIFGRVERLGGWTVGQVAFLYGLSGVAFGLVDLLVSPVELTSDHVKAGTFDRFLIRPVGPLWQLCGTEFSLRRAGRLIQPLIVLTIACGATGIRWRPSLVLLTVLALVAGTAIYGAIWVVTASIAFWSVDAKEVGNAFTYGGGTVTSYPVDVFAGWLRGFITFVLPLAWVAYLPGAIVYGKPIAFGLPRLAVWTVPLVALAAMAVARGVWGAGLRQYRSTGS